MTTEQTNLSELWKHMSETHGLSLTITEENDIRHAADNDREAHIVEQDNALSDALFALSKLVDWGRDNISPAHDPGGHEALMLAYETLKRLSPLYNEFGS